MNKQDNKIHSFHADNLWNGELQIDWNDIHPDVNILVGVNGVGKTTLLNVLYDNLQADHMPVVYLKCTDNPVRDKEKSESVLLQELKYIVMENDENFSFTNYRLQMLDQPERHDLVQKRLNDFYILVNKMFAETGKTIHVEKGKLTFHNKRGASISLDKLSSGEKQLLIILLKVFLMECQECIILMDEPELSMDINWQYVLLDTLVSLNPNAQFILTAHSPSILSKGWGDHVVYMEDIVKLTSDEKE